MEQTNCKDDTNKKFLLKETIGGERISDRELFTVASHPLPVGHSEDSRLCLKQNKVQ